jgi:hypothetical protein
MAGLWHKARHKHHHQVGDRAPRGSSSRQLAIPESSPLRTVLEFGGDAHFSLAGEGVEEVNHGPGKKDPRFHREKFCAVADFFSLAVFC